MSARLPLAAQSRHHGRSVQGQQRTSAQEVAKTFTYHLKQPMKESASCFRYSCRMQRVGKRFENGLHESKLGGPSSDRHCGIERKDLPRSDSCFFKSPSLNECGGEIRVRNAEIRTGLDRPRCCVHR